MISNRTRLSACQYLALLPRDSVCLLFEKHGLPVGRGTSYSTELPLRDIQASVALAADESIISLLDELARTVGANRLYVNPRYAHDSRWDDFARCLMLDGYTLHEKGLRTVDPSIDAAKPQEDELKAELQRTSLVEKDTIIQLLSKSTEAFRQAPPDFNTCLTQARVALETLAKAVAKVRRSKHPDNFDETKWGQVIAYLKKSGLITQEEEQALVGIYGLLSQGAHNLIGLSQDEMTGLGYRMAAAMCYFLVKVHNKSMVA